MEGNDTVLTALYLLDTGAVRSVYESSLTRPVYVTAWSGPVSFEMLCLRAPLIIKHVEVMWR